MNVTEFLEVHEAYHSNMRIVRALSPVSVKKVEDAMRVTNVRDMASTRLEVVRELPPMLLKDPYYGFYCETRGNDQWIYVTVKTKRWIRFKA